MSARHAHNAHSCHADKQSPSMQERPALLGCHPGRSICNAALLCVLCRCQAAVLFQHKQATRDCLAVVFQAVAGRCFCK